MNCLYFNFDTINGSRGSYLCQPSYTANLSFSSPKTPACSLLTYWVTHSGTLTVFMDALRLLIGPKPVHGLVLLESNKWSLHFQKEAPFVFCALLLTVLDWSTVWKRFYLNIFRVSCSSGMLRSGASLFTRSCGVKGGRSPLLTLKNPVVVFINSS